MARYGTEEFIIESSMKRVLKGSAQNGPKDKNVGYTRQENQTEKVDGDTDLGR